MRSENAFISCDIRNIIHDKLGIHSTYGSSNRLEARCLVECTESLDSTTESLGVHDWLIQLLSSETTDQTLHLKELNEIKYTSNTTINSLESCLDHVLALRPPTIVSKEEIKSDQSQNVRILRIYTTYF